MIDAVENVAGAAPGDGAGGGGGDESGEGENGEDGPEEDVKEGREEQSLAILGQDQADQTLTHEGFDHGGEV